MANRVATFPAVSCFTVLSGTSWAKYVTLVDIYLFNMQARPVESAFAESSIRVNSTLIPVLQIVRSDQLIHGLVTSVLESGNQFLSTVSN